MQCLITGGGGYLGCCVTARLTAEGHGVRVLDRFCFGAEPAAYLRALPQCEVLIGDVRRLQEHPRLFEGIEAVIHLASLSNDPSCALNPDMTHDVNVESTLELAKQAAEAGVRRFVFGSTCLVYGRGVFDWLDEQSPANPVSVFGQSKLEAEHALLIMRNDHFEPVIARTATLFGVSPRMRFDLALNQMAATAMREKRIMVRGGGQQWRPLVHVDDAARAFLALVEAAPEDVSGEVFNTGDTATNLRIVELAQRVAAAFPETAIEVATDDDDLRSFRVCFDKLRERLGFHCEKTLDDGVAEVRDFLARRDVDPGETRFFNVKRVKELMAMRVDQGGEPVAARFVALAKPTLGPEEETAVIEALRSGWLTSGPKVPAFEKAFAKTVTAPYAVGVCSCTAALHLALVDAGVGPGDEVITTPITWASTANTLVHMGVKPVFAEVDPRTMNLCPAAIEAAITPRTKAIMPVHLAGYPCDLDAIDAIARKHGVAVIEDAAHALGAVYKDTPVGAYSAYTCFSFYAIKNITTMEGGIVTVQDPETAERIRVLSTNGLSATAWDRYGRSAAPSPLEVVTPGFKYAMGNVSAAIGLEQLKKFAAFKAARQRVAHMYHAVLADVDEIVLPEDPPEGEHAWHLYIIRLKLDRIGKTRDEVAQALRMENIGTGVHFYGLHLHRYYRAHLGLAPDDLPEATKASREILSLPLHPRITDKNVHEVVTALKKVLAHARR